MSTFTPGQRWISKGEPELGLGVVIEVEGRRVQILFPATGEMRQYAMDTAPIKRFELREGEVATNHEGEKITVEAVLEEGGLLSYRGAGQQFLESQLEDTYNFSGPVDRLLAGQADEPSAFDLRVAALTHQQTMRASRVRGLTGARMDLIPHQLFIAHEVSRRRVPRVLLADEVGLGKTIEACLIVHRLLLTGRAKRILIVVPEALVHQWFVELLRRFNFKFSIFDEERCAAIQAGDPAANPFEDDQLILTDIHFLSTQPNRAVQAVEAGWDMLVADEAHHLAWSPNEKSPGYAVVEALADVSHGLLLLTATPEQLGPESHFARLRLLDQQRYNDLDHYLKESESYQQVAGLISKLDSGKKLTVKDQKTLANYFPKVDDLLGDRISQAAKGDAEARAALAEDLLDQHGTGRVMFRNTRLNMSGFPKRKAHLIKLPTENDKVREAIWQEFQREWKADAMKGRLTFRDDPRIKWLAEFLRTHKKEKVLLICRTREKVMAIHEALQIQIKVNTGLFHEDMELIQRDRQAAWFSEEDGARILLCSEIGGEGRNFQFAQHLVLFDLPHDPELLEQRIGRLDRIGQKKTIQIHVLMMQGTCGEALARWYHEGLNAFEQSLSGGMSYFQHFRDQLFDMAKAFHAQKAAAGKALENCIMETARYREEVVNKLEQGRDRLLERHSHNKDLSEELVHLIEQRDADGDLEQFMLLLFDQYGVHSEDLSPGLWRLLPGHTYVDAFPALSHEGALATFHRSVALSRDDMQFLSWDHPMVTGSIEMLLASELGNASVLLKAGMEETPLALETYYLSVTTAPNELRLDRFMPPQPIRVVINHEKADVTAEEIYQLENMTGTNGVGLNLLDNTKVRQKLLPAMLRAAQAVAKETLATLVETSITKAEAELNHEWTRMKQLQERFGQITAEELEIFMEYRTEVIQHLEQSNVRLDAIRVLVKSESD